MVESKACLDSVFHALADPTRRAMLASMAVSAQSVGELAAPHRMSFAAAAKHVKVLESAGLVRKEAQGRVQLCHLEPGPLARASDYLAHYARFWNTRLDALEAMLARGDDLLPTLRPQRTSRARLTARPRGKQTSRGRKR